MDIDTITIISPEIVNGSLVVLKKPSSHMAEETKTIADRWIKGYGKGPFRVLVRNPEHVSLVWEDTLRNRHKKGDLVHFGGAEVSIHIDYIELWKEDI